jgi:hypothetical protein
MHRAFGEVPAAGVSRRKFVTLLSSMTILLSVRYSRSYSLTGCTEYFAAAAGNIISTLLIRRAFAACDYCTRGLV